MWPSSANLECDYYAYYRILIILINWYWRIDSNSIREIAIYGSANSSNLSNLSICDSSALDPDLLILFHCIQALNYRWILTVDSQFSWSRCSVSGRRGMRAATDSTGRSGKLPSDCAISAHHHFPYCENALEYKMYEKDGLLRSIDPSVPYPIKPTNRERL